MEFITGLLTAIGTAIATYYTVLNPRKISVKEYQLNKLYLPLMQKFAFQNTVFVDIESQMTFYKYFEELLKDNLQYVPPTMYKMYNRLTAAILNKNLSEFQNCYTDLCEHTELEFDFLKSKLGLPNDGFKYRFDHMSKKGKAYFILAFIANTFTILLIACIYLILIYTMLNESSNTFDKFTSYCLLTFSVGVIFISVKFLIKPKK